MRGTGTLVLTDDEVAFAQWRPDHLVRIPRPAIVEVDTTRVAPRQDDEPATCSASGGPPPSGEDTVAFFVRDLDPWLADLGGTRVALDA